MATGFGTAMTNVLKFGSSNFFFNSFLGTFEK